MTNPLTPPLESELRHRAFETEINLLNNRAEHRHKILAESAAQIARIPNPKFNLANNWQSFLRCNYEN